MGSTSCRATILRISCSGIEMATKKVEIVQFVPINFIGAALKAGGHHNADAIVQIEMVGFSDEKLWLPEQDTLDALCSLFNVCEYEWGIPLSHPWPDGDYGMAGFHTKHRGSGKFGKVAGWFGHADVPDNDHWDPGNLRWSKVFARCHELQAADWPIQCRDANSQRRHDYTSRCHPSQYHPMADHVAGIDP
jgi:hypothetical protein